MLKKYKKISLVIIIFIFNSIFADQELTLDEVNEIKSNIEKIYSPLTRPHDARLLIDVKWDGKDSSQVNLGSEQMGNTWFIYIFKGYIHLPGMDKDSLALSLCHEVGHHFGGYPFKTIWASVEGQSDYYANHICTSLLWQDEQDINQHYTNKVDSISKSRCDLRYLSLDKKHLCYRKATAALNLANVMAKFSKKKEIDPGLKDLPVVEKTLFNKHASPQCRFETLIRGALCGKPMPITKIPGKTSWAIVPVPREPAGSNKLWAAKESEKFICSLNDQDSNFLYGSRPRCWYKPITTLDNQ